MVGEGGKGSEGVDPGHTTPVLSHSMHSPRPATQVLGWGVPRDFGTVPPPRPVRGSNVRPGGCVPLTVFFLRLCLGWALLATLLLFLQDKERSQNAAGCHSDAAPPCLPHPCVRPIAKAAWPLGPLAGDAPATARAAWQPVAALGDGAAAGRMSGRDRAAKGQPGHALCTPLECGWEDPLGASQAGGNVWPAMRGDCRAVLLVLAPQSLLHSLVGAVREP